MEVAEAQVLDFKGDLIYEATHADILGVKKNKKQGTVENKLYKTVDTKLELWSFLLGASLTPPEKAQLQN